MVVSSEGPLLSFLPRLTFPLQKEMPISMILLRLLNSSFHFCYKKRKGSISHMKSILAIEEGVNVLGCQ